MAKKRRSSPWSEVVACQSDSAWWRHHGNSYTRLPYFVYRLALRLFFYSERSFQRFEWLDDQFRCIAGCRALGDLLIVWPRWPGEPLGDDAIAYLARRGRVLGPSFIIERHTPAHYIRELREAVSGEA